MTASCWSGRGSMLHANIYRVITNKTALYWHSACIPCSVRRLGLRARVCCASQCCIHPRILMVCVLSARRIRDVSRTTNSLSAASHVRRRKSVWCPQALANSPSLLPSANKKRGSVVSRRFLCWRPLILQPSCSMSQQSRLSLSSRSIF